MLAVPGHLVLPPLARKQICIVEGCKAGAEFWKGGKVFQAGRPAYAGGPWPMSLTWTAVRNGRWCLSLTPSFVVLVFVLSMPNFSESLLEVGTGCLVRAPWLTSCPTCILVIGTLRLL